MSPDEPYPSYHIQAKRLTEAKKQYLHLKDAHSQVLQQVLRTLDRAFEDMRAKKLGFPRFKNKNRMRSFVYPQLGKNPLVGNRLKMPGLGFVELYLSRPIPEGFVLKQARVVRKVTGYFVMLTLQSDVDVPEPLPSGHPRGLDLGYDKFVATSDGQEVLRPRFLKTLHRKLKKYQRRLKKKQKGSKNRAKLNQKIARVHQKISDTRRDWHYKLSHSLCNGAGMLFVEDIDFRSWQRGMFSKHSADAGFGQFVTILQWVAWGRGLYFGKVDKNYTSQVCPQCGTHTGKKELGVRTHVCNECQYTCSRDVAAAQIIMQRGINAVGQTVLENACGDGLTGANGNVGLVKNQRSRKLKK
jgi:putative transposase